MNKYSGRMKAIGINARRHRGCSLNAEPIAGLHFYKQKNPANRPVTGLQSRFKAI